MDNNDKHKDDLRNRFKIAQQRFSVTDDSEDDILDIWEDQKRMHAEEVKRATQISLAKAKIKEQNKAIRRKQFFYAKQLLCKRLSKTLNACRGFFKKAYSSLRSNRKLSMSVIVLGVIVLGVVSYTMLGSDVSPKDTLGESVNTQNSASADLPQEDPDFSLLYPQGSDDGYEVVRISPQGSAPSYTYLDQISDEGVIFRVTQQQIPEGFDLKETATGFQATDIIQVDGINVYHGYSNQGGVQSLIFIKDDILFSIRSPQVLSDETWVGYVSSLK